MGSISDYIGQHTQSYSEDANQRHSPAGGGRNRQQAGRLPRAEDGQHYATSFYTPGDSSGFKSSIKESARVGHTSGGEQAMSVHGVHTTVMTEHVDGAGPTPGIVTGNNKGVN